MPQHQGIERKVIMKQFLEWHGFGSYQEYLESDMWFAIRKRIWSRDKGLCVVCSQPGQCVHHRSYKAKVLRGDYDPWLITLCASCHEYIEFELDGRKIPSSKPKRKEQLLASILMRHKGMTLSSLDESLERLSLFPDEAPEESTDRSIPSRKRSFHENEKELRRTNRILKQVCNELEQIKAENRRLKKRVAAFEKNLSVSKPILVGGVSPLAKKIARLKKA